MASLRSILSLPISPNAPIYHLTPDPLFPSPASLLSLSSYEPSQSLDAPGPITLAAGDPIPPSMARRSRMVRGGGAFSYTSPLPLAFPYEIQESDGEAGVKAVTIETKLAEFEASTQFPVGEGVEGGKPGGFTSKLRKNEAAFPAPRLLSFSKRCRDEWLPNLEVGDAATLVKNGLGSAKEVKARQELVDVLGGRTVLAREGQDGGTSQIERDGFAPWSLCYGGHQFGNWAGQLGDGRAISILSTPSTPEVKEKLGSSTIELQLKGAGRTPYSRFADGLAVLRSSVREYLGAEAMAALGQPTSRGLALVGIPDVKVRRERLETAAIVTRVSTSWIRIGNFEIQANRQEWESLRLLTSHVGTNIFEFSDASAASLDSEKGRGLGLNVLREVSRKTAIMIAGWQAYGFCHGVMNTDNIAVSGACIDYGPYAFMDIFDAGHVCNHSDEEGRYSYRNQPTMGVFAVDKLGQSLAPLIGAEESTAQAENSAHRTGYVEVAQGWGEDHSKLAAFKEAGLLRVEEVKGDFVSIFMAEYTRLMRLRLGFLSSQPGDFDLTSSLLDLMQLHSLDYSHTFRLLSQFPLSATSSLLPRFLELFLPASQIPDQFRPAAVQAAESWLATYRDRLTNPEEVAAGGDVGRKELMDSVNPRFTLRQWVLEETIAKLDTAEPDLLALDLVLEMSSEPFKSYGEEIIEKKEGESCAVEGEQEREERRLCELGSTGMLGFQCSCSS